MIDSIVKAAYAPEVIRAIEGLFHYLFPERAIVEKLAAGAAVITVYAVGHQAVYFVKRCNFREGAQNSIQHRRAAPAGAADINNFQLFHIRCSTTAINLTSPQFPDIHPRCFASHEGRSVYHRGEGIQRRFQRVYTARQNA